MPLEESSDCVNVGKMIVVELTKRAMRSVNLLSRDETSNPYMPSDVVLFLADEKRLPLTLAFGAGLPAWSRWLVLRQHAMRVLISSAILAADLALGCGWFWLMAWISAQFGPVDFGLAFVTAVLHGATSLFGRTALLSLALALLCQPLRRQPVITEVTE